MKYTCTGAETLHYVFTVFTFISEIFGILSAFLYMFQAYIIIGTLTWDKLFWLMRSAYFVFNLVNCFINVVVGCEDFENTSFEYEDQGEFRAIDIKFIPLWAYIVLLVIDVVAAVVSFLRFFGMSKMRYMSLLTACVDFLQIVFIWLATYAIQTQLESRFPATVYLPGRSGTYVYYVKRNWDSQFIIEALYIVKMVFYGEDLDQTFQFVYVFFLISTIFFVTAFLVNFNARPNRYSA